MKKTVIKICFMLGMLCSLFFVGKTTSKAASNITLNSLDFQINLKQDGNMEVTENWNARIRSTNTMFKTFELDTTKFKQITNVEVYKINEDNTKTKLTQITKEMYHVTKDCYYGLVTSSGDFEIAWGVSIEEAQTRKYQLKYTVVDAIKNYQDCSELYWQLVGDKNAIPVTKLTASITLPKTAKQKENVRAWVHGPYNGNFTVQNNGINIDLDYLDPETMVEARLITLETDMFPKATLVFKNKLNTILNEEQKWANVANAEREEYIREQQIKEKEEKKMFIILMIVQVVLTIFFIYKLIKNFKQLRKTPKLEKIQGIDYFREIPDETASAGDAAFLYYFKTGYFASKISKILSATILQLSLKKYIFLSEDNSKQKPEIRINLLDFSNNKETTKPLKKDEQIVYNLLQDVGKNYSNTFTMQQFENYAKNHSRSFVTKMQNFEEEVKIEQERLGNYSEKNLKDANKRLIYASLYLSLGIISLSIIPFAAICMLLNAIPSFMIYARMNQLTDAGRLEQAKWKGLKKYMEDFSLLNEKEVPDLVLWEKFLVFATAFGIADKVLKQLKVRYPELQNVDNYQYSYMHLLYHSTLNTAFLSSLSTATNHVYMGGMSSQAQSGYSGGNFSSGGGFGGGFSGGGGFGGGGGRNGRKIVKNGKCQHIKTKEKQRKKEKIKEK